MSNKKATKRALLTSITALAMCVVMLVGTTFAWFTDTATANVNKIQAGKLDVALEMQKADGTWENAEGKTLEFKKADAAPSGEEVLWEPGATYELPKLRVVNNGNLNIKCRVEVTGIKKVTTAATPAGTFDLNDVIAWTATGLDLDTNFIMKSTDGAKEFTISGTMDTAAGNDYQGLTIDGVSITVYATQAEGEFDSNRDDYDKDATYTRTNATVIDETTGKTVTLEKGKSYTVGTATITVSDSGDITYVNSGSGQTVTINTDGGNLTVDAANDTVYHYGRVGIVTVTAVAGNSYHEFGDASVLAIAKGRAVIEKADAVKVLQVTGDDAVIAVPQNVVVDTKLEKAGDVSTIVINTIDNNGDVVTTTKISDDSATTTKGEGENAATPNELSKIITDGKAEVDEAEEYAAIIGSTGYASLADAVAAAKDGDTVTLLKSTNGGGIVAAEGKFAAEGLTVDFNGHSYTVGGVLVGSSGTGTNASQLLRGNKITFKNGSFVGVTEGTKPAKDTPNWHGAPAMMIQNYCDLTLENMTVTGGDETVYTMSNNNGVVVINNTTINAGGAKGYGYGPYAFDVCNFATYPSVEVTVTGNSVINGDVEIARGSTTKAANNTLILGDCTINGNILKSDGTLNFAGNVTLNGDVNVTDKTDAKENFVVVTGATTLNLNGKIITPNDMGNNNTNFTALIVDADTTINAGVNGGIDTQENGGYGINVRNGATLTINGGTYYGGGTAVQVQKGTLVINDGTFEVEPYSNPTYGYKFLINCIDAAYKDGTAKIMVRGGSFVNYDPSDSASENPRGNFVDEGYSCTENNGVWTVTKNG